MAPRPQNNRKQAPTSELGAVGTQIYGGYVREEFLTELQGSRGAKLFREMRTNDPICGAMIYAFETKIKSTPFKLKASEGGEEVKGFVQECLDDMDWSWRDHLSDAVEFLTYGYSVHEIVYKLRDGKGSKFDDMRIGWKKMPIRAQESIVRWEVELNGDIKGFHQLTPQGVGAYIPMDKALHYRTTRKRNNPEGFSILRTSYRPYYNKKRLEDLEGIGAERDLTGIPKIRVPANVIQGADEQSVSARNEWIKVGQGLKVDEQAYVMIPSNRDNNGEYLYDLDLISAPGNRQVNLSQPIERYARQMAMTVLADIILLGHERVGSYAMAETKADLLNAGIQAFVDDIAEEFTRSAIKRLVVLNGWDEALAPTMEAGQVSNLSTIELGTLLATLSGAGANLLPDPVLQDYLRQRAGLPVGEETEPPEIPDPMEQESPAGLYGGNGPTSGQPKTKLPQQQNRKGNSGERARKKPPAEG